MPKFIDRVMVGEAPRLLSELVKERGYDGEMRFVNVTIWAYDARMIFIKKKFKASSPDPGESNDTDGVPVPADGSLTFSVLELDSVWAWVATGAPDAPLFIVDDDFRTN